MQIGTPELLMPVAVNCRFPLSPARLGISKPGARLPGAFLEEAGYNHKQPIEVISFQPTALDSLVNGSSRWR